MGGTASRLCVSTASCRPWAGPNSRALGLPAPSPRPGSSGEQPRRRPAWRWMWAASMVSCPLPTGVSRPQYAPGIRRSWPGGGSLGVAQGEKGQHAGVGAGPGMGEGSWGREGADPGSRARVGRQAGKWPNWATDASWLSPAPAAAPGDQFSCPVHSWSTGEEVAGDILKHRLAPGRPHPAHPCVLGKEGGGGAGDQTPPHHHGVHSGHAGGLARAPRFLQAVPVGSIPHLCPSMCCHQGAGRWLAGLDGGHEEWGPVGRAGRPRLCAGPGV